MENYKQASKVGQEMILTYFLKRMKELKISKGQLAKTLEVGDTTLWRWFRMETPIPLGIYLEICGALKEVPPQLQSAI